MEIFGNLGEIPHTGGKFLGSKGLNHMELVSLRFESS